MFEQPGGYKVARVTTGGSNVPVQGIGLTCERKVPMIALSLARAPARNPALLSLSDGKSTGKLGVVRNGKTNIWAGPVRDARVLDMLARAGSVIVSIDGAAYGTVSLVGAADAMRGALGGCWARTAVAATLPVAPKVIDPDEEAVRAIVASIYGWRDGRKVKEAGGDEWTHLFSPRIRELLAQCEGAVENSDPKANGGEGAYTITGDQGCLSVPFLFEPVSFEAAPFIPGTRPVVRRIGLDTIESEIVVPAAARTEWGASETIRFQRSGGQWLIDEIVTKRTDRGELYSAQIAAMTAELRKIARKPTRARKR